jgi:hypothetical protein
VDGSTTLVGGVPVGVGDLVRAKVTGTEGVDLNAVAVEVLSPAGGS